MTQFYVSRIYSSQVFRVKSSSLLLTQFFQLLVAAHKTVSTIKLFLVPPHIMLCTPTLKIWVIKTV